MAGFNPITEAYFTKIATLFCDSGERQYSPPEFYSSVAFYNFLPDVFRVRQRVEKNQLLNPDAQRFFFRVVDYVKPERILITGERLWRALPSCIPGANGTRRVCEDGTRLDVQFGGDDPECCWYSVEGAKDCLVGAITHPSAKKFSGNRAAIREPLRRCVILQRRLDRR
jgi:hypothetical protein